MIHFLTGDILESDAEALVNTVNTMGIMGKGVALQFRRAFPSNFKAYVEACKNDKVTIGKMFVVRDQNFTSGKKIIINFPTKSNWRKPSEYAYIEMGLQDLRKVIEEEHIKSLAIPPLGAGNGGLDWQKVKVLIQKYLTDIPAHVVVYEPTALILEHLKKERVKLTAARSLLLYVLYDLVRNGEYVSEFSSEKVCYFLQRFGAEKHLGLKFEPNFYGPYSGKVRFVLNALNGSYIMGYSDMNKKPFEPLTLVADGYKDVAEVIEGNPELSGIAERTVNFLTGFYADFALELLSSLDYIILNYRVSDKSDITKKLEDWSDRKRTLFSNSMYIDVSMNHLQKAGIIPI